MRTEVADEPPAVLELVRALTSALDESAVSYCHWKSNEALARSLTGDNDLDLLVARHHAGPFRACVETLGFRRASPAHDRAIPAIEDYYGFDEPTGRTVHVQAHYHLVLGDDMTKNYRLPIEPAYLTDLDTAAVLPIPRAELEYVVLVLRLVLKHCPWDAIAARKGRPTDSERRELAWLEARLRPGTVDAVLRQHVPFVTPALFARCLAGIAPGAGVLARVRAGSAVQRALDHHGQRSHRADLVVKAQRRVRRAVPALASPVRRRPDTGGMVIAVVGGDGSGKSSAVAAIAEMLNREIDTETFHLGKPPASLTTRVARRIMRPWRDRGRLASTREPSWTEFDRFPGYGYMVWHLLIANDRRRAYRRIRRITGAGTVAVCDRWPGLGLATMDGPRLGSLPGMPRRPLARWMSAAEGRCYREMLAPDLMLVLRVRPELAVGRRPEQDAEFVRRRAREVYERVWSGHAQVVVDADRPHDEVLNAVRSAVWSHL